MQSNQANPEMGANQPNAEEESVLNIPSHSTQEVTQPTTEVPVENTNPPLNPAPVPERVPSPLDEGPEVEQHTPPPAYLIDPAKREAKLAADKQLQEKLAARSLPSTGNPNASVMDPYMAKVEPRYHIVQNRSD